MFDRTYHQIYEQGQIKDGVGNSDTEHQKRKMEKLIKAMRRLRDSDVQGLLLYFSTSIFVSISVLQYGQVPLPVIYFVVLSSGAVIFPLGVVIFLFKIAVFGRPASSSDENKHGSKQINEPICE